MTSVDRWLLPDGIDEILPPQARQIERLRRQLLDYLDNSGYAFVIPPALEYLDSLLTGTGQDLDLKTFKVTDQLSGRMMGLSADTTPQVARMDAHSWAQQGTSRFSYCRTVFHTKPNSLLAGRTPTQIGAELYGDDSIDADVEIISILVSLLEQAGIEQPHIDLGSVGVVRCVIRAANLDQAATQELFGLIRSKCASDIQQWAEERIEDPQLAQALVLMTQLQGNLDTVESGIEQLSQWVPAAANELSRVRSVLSRVNQRFPSLSILLDLSELRGFDYHTSLVFAAYVPGYGDSIAQGGRYDETGAVFGRARPATGFSADLKVLAELGQYQEACATCIAAPQSDDPALWQLINQLRQQGHTVLTDSLAANDASQAIQNIQGQWQLVSLSTSSD